MNKEYKLSKRDKKLAIFITIFTVLLLAGIHIPSLQFLSQIQIMKKYKLRLQLCL